MKIHLYDAEKFNFKKLIQDLYEIKDLSLLHTKFDKEYDVGGLGSDTHTIYHNLFYDKLKAGWLEIEALYASLITDVVAPLSSEDFLYQRFPSYRIQLPNNKAVTLVHCDSDENHKHPLGEINFLFPLTEMKNTNSVWVESEPGLGDFKPMEANFGTLIQFNGNVCRHYNKINEEGKTRISMDFRILPISLYDPNYEAKTATAGLKFVEGEYYKKFQNHFYKDQ